MDHDAEACGACQFVAHPDFIRVTSNQREKAAITLGRMIRWALGLGNLDEGVIELGVFTMPGWSGHSMFYLVECFGCGDQYADYAHSYHLYLNCPNCGWRAHLENERFYKERGLTKPPGPIRRLIYSYKTSRAIRRLRDAS